MTTAGSSYLNTPLRSLAQAPLDSGAVKPCASCRGSGKIAVRQNVSDDDGGTVTERCPTCHGTGRAPEEK